MSKSNSFENEMLLHVFQNASISGIGTGLPAAGTAGSLYVALFTAMSDGEAQTFTEANYTNYARVAVARSAAGWAVSGNNASNVAAVQFPMAGSSETITHFGICKAGTRAVADVIYYGVLSSSLAVSNGVIPEFAAGNLDIYED